MSVNDETRTDPDELEPTDSVDSEAPPATPAGPAPLSRQVKVALAVLAVAALAALFWPRTGDTFAAPGGFLVDGGGRPVKLAGRMAPVTLVHFWATWCAPCITEIPALKRLAADFGDEPTFDLVMIAVDDEATKVEPFLGQLSPMALYDPNWDVAKRYGTSKLPETYLVHRGQVIEKWIGATDWDHPAIREQLREAVAEASAPADPSL